MISGTITQHLHVSFYPKTFSSGTLEKKCSLPLSVIPHLLRTYFPPWLTSYRHGKRKLGPKVNILAKTERIYLFIEAKLTKLKAFN